MTKTKPSSPFEIIEGINPILLIAPHGHSKNDEKTGELTRLMAERLDCCAVINEHFRRPDKKKSEKINIPKSIVNLNHIPDSLKPGVSFLQPIIDSKNKIISTHPKAIVVLIHGVDDENIKVYNVNKDDKEQQVDILIGIGLSKTPDKATLSIPKAEADKLQAILEKLGVNSTFAIGGKYSGREATNLNQLFTAQNKRYQDNKVQSIQLEIKKTGFRDNNENIQAAAEILSAALAELLNIQPRKKNIQESVNAKVPANLDARITQNTTEKQVDYSLVDQATEEIMQMCYSSQATLLFDLGEYLIKNFYGDSRENALAEKPVKEKSLRCLIQNIRKKHSNAPSQSFLYRSVQLVVDNDNIKLKLPKSFATYGNLQISQKVLLLPVTNLRFKEMLIRECHENKYTVIHLGKRIADIRNTNEITDTKAITRSAPENISKIIKKPELLFSPNFSAQLDKAAISALPPAVITKLRSKAQEQASKMKEEVERYQLYVERYNKLIEDLDSVDKKEGTKNDSGKD